MMQRDQRNLGMYILGQRGTGCKRLFGRLLTRQDHITGSPLVLREPFGKTNADGVKEGAADATKKQETSQPKA